MMLRWEITSRGYSEASQQANVLMFLWGHSSKEPQRANSEKSQKLVNETKVIKLMLSLNSGLYKPAVVFFELSIIQP